MPTWPVRCECGGKNSALLSYSKRMEEYGGQVPCSKCGALCTPGVTAPAIQGLNPVRVAGSTFESTAAADAWADKNNMEFVDRTSRTWQTMREQVRQDADSAARKQGYSDHDDYRRNIHRDLRDRTMAAREKQIKSYHDKHGSEGRQTVEQAFKD